ncbi:protein kinase domain-containing protein [Kibdelosporangium philippinense]
MAEPSTDSPSTWPSEVRGRSGHNLRLMTDAPLGEGGEGVVFRTDNDQLAVKIFKHTSETSTEDVAGKLDRLRWLPLDDVPICRPLEPLATPHFGYVMELLHDMVAWRSISNAPKENIEQWYAEHGGLSRRLVLLARCAEVLRTLHERGIVYGDVSPGNILVSSTAAFTEVWLIDADNLQTESTTAATPLATQDYTAPELLRRLSGNTASSDMHSFAVIAYETLTTNHPLYGDHVMEGPVEYEVDAQYGRIPWIDHSSDALNRTTSGFPAVEVTTARLRDLFARTFEAGMTDPHARPSAGEWADALWTAAARTVRCVACPHTYFAVSAYCPWCEMKRPAALVVTVEERFPRLGEFASVVLPRNELTHVLQKDVELVIRARTTHLAPGDPNRPVLSLKWDGGENIRVQNLDTRAIRRVPPRGGNGMQFFPGTKAKDNAAAPWSIHFGTEHRPHRIVRVSPASNGSGRAR